MKHRKTFLAIFIIGIVFCCTPLMAKASLAASADFSGGWALTEKQKAKAMGATYGVTCRFGCDITDAINVFGEGAFNGLVVTVNKASFQNVPNTFGGMFGGGAALSFGNGFSLSLSGGAFINRLNRDVKMLETGLYASLTPKYLLFSPLANSDLFNYSVSVPVSMFFSGMGIETKVSIAIGIDVSSYGKRAGKKLSFGF